MHNDATRSCNGGPPPKFIVNRGKLNAIQSCNQSYKYKLSENFTPMLKNNNRDREKESDRERERTIFKNIMYELKHKDFQEILITSIT